MSNGEAIISTPEASNRRLEVAGDDTAEARFRRFASGELRRSYRLAGLLLGGAADAEDAVQDALLRAWRELGSLRDTDRFQAWFDRILVNVCRDRLRRRRIVRFVPLPTDPAIGRAPDPFRSVLERDETLRAMAGLGPEERAVIVLHYWADLTLEDVARRMGLPTGTVKTRLHRALRSLAGTLGQERDSRGST